MINWHDDTTGTLEGDCPWHDDRVFAELVARRLDIPLHVVDLSDHYRSRVVDYMFAEYARGRTPNPDVLCKPRKSSSTSSCGRLLRLGADYVWPHGTLSPQGGAAHARRQRRLQAACGQRSQQGPELLSLCQLSHRAAAACALPVGDLLKPESAAHRCRAAALATARRRIRRASVSWAKGGPAAFPPAEAGGAPGQRPRNPSSWRGYGRAVTGEDLAAMAEPYRYTVRDGKKIGEHDGAHFYTIGQRKDWVSAAARSRCSCWRPTWAECDLGGRGR